ncbi:MAG: 2-oxo acid dehydrogenase subunit E2, partial [Actinomycetota bacterium]|nr:2-oxo acid dehydrogenase subunit E2 [Actinomycetota bacterium]
MPESSEANPLSAFGANEWLVDEMYEQYQRDPNSVDKAWWDFFRDFENGDAAKQPPGNGTTQGNGPASEPVKTGSKAQHRAETPAPEKAPEKSEEKSGPKAEPKSETKSAAKAEAPSSASAAAATQPKSDAVPKEPEPKQKVEATDEPAYTVLRGAPARTVQNMDVSLTVPTATSVRSVPVKLLWDNRTVINNHLARARGGKVSFTHVIGYALVKALKSMPEMNVGYDVVDGKPTLITPKHINLGLAIDLPKPDGTRQLLVPSIKAVESMDFAHFWTAYEELVRRARDNKLAVTDFQGTTISLTNPGTIGTNHSVPR